MVDTPNVVQQVAGIPLNVVTWGISSIVTFGIGATVKPIIDNIFKNFINKLFKDLKGGNVSFLSKVKDPEVRAWISEGLYIGARKGTPAIEEQLSQISLKIEQIANNPIATAAIEGIKKDIFDNLKTLAIDNAAKVTVVPAVSLSSQPIQSTLPVVPSPVMSQVLD